MDGRKPLFELLGALGHRTDASYLVVMHVIGDSSTFNLDRTADSNTDLNVCVPEDRSAIERGRVYIAPPDLHLSIEEDLIRLVRGPRENRFRPSIDVLFRSAAAYHGTKVSGVVLSGLLDDGVVGSRIIKQRGGCLFVQSPAEAGSPDLPENLIAEVQTDGIGSVKGIAEGVEGWLDSLTGSIGEAVRAQSRVASGDRLCTRRIQRPLQRAPRKTAQRILLSELRRPDVADG